MNNAVLKLEGNDDFFIQEAYKVLRSNLQFCGQDIKIIVITSCHENEGKTTISLQLGKNFSELNKKVIVIDADLRKSVMASRHFDIQSPHGLSEVLSGLDSFENAVCHTQYEGLDILLAGKYPPNPVELLGSVHFENLIARLREEYDYVIVDTAPLGLVIDAAVISPICDGTVIVMSNKVRFKVAKEVLEQLEKSGSKILGVVRNKIGFRQKSRHYKYGKRGYSRYGYGRYGYRMPSRGTRASAQSDQNAAGDQAKPTAAEEPKNPEIV